MIRLMLTFSLSIRGGLLGPKRSKKLILTGWPLALRNGAILKCLWSTGKLDRWWIGQCVFGNVEPGETSEARQIRRNHGQINGLAPGTNADGLEIHRPFKCAASQIYLIYSSAMMFGVTLPTFRSLHILFCSA